MEPDSSYAYQLGGAASGLLGPTDSVILPIWILDGKQETANLLRFIFPTQLEKCVLILCSSLDKPGNGSFKINVLQFKFCCLLNSYRDHFYKTS